MMPTSLKATALAVAAVILQADALAAPTEAQLNSIKLYSDVTIAQDTVTGWGPWTEFEPPAAGNPPLNLPPANSDLYRNLAQVGGTNVPLVGFGAFYTLVNQDGTPVANGQVNQVNLSGSGTLRTGQTLFDSLQLQMTPVTGVYPSPTSVQLTLQPDGTYARTSDLEVTRLVLIPTPGVQSTNTPVSFYQLLSYISDGDANIPTVQGVTHTGVIGTQTDLVELAALQRGNVTATYNGLALNNQGIFSPVVIKMDFGKSSWSGMWNNGADANGAVGFSASGTIQGAQFSSTPGSITALDSNNVSGSVRGGFFGSQAGAVGGTSDITKNGVQHSDSFVAYRPLPGSTTPTPGIPAGSSTK